MFSAALPRAPSALETDKPSPKSKPASSKTFPTELGVYINLNGKWSDLPAEKADWKTGGVLKSIARGSIVGGSGVDVDIYLTGPTSSMTAPRKSEFMLYVAEGDVAASYQLVKLTQKQDRREFKGGRSGFFGVKSGPGKAAVPFEANKISARTYLIKLSLEVGEYCFFKSSSGLNDNSGIVYSFKVIALIGWVLDVRAWTIHAAGLITTTD